MPTGDLASRVSHLASPVSGILIWLAGVVALGIAFLALYRAQPPYPYPLLRLLPATDALLAALLVIRSGPALARRAPALLDGLAVAGLGVWTAAALFAAQDHVTLSIPGVEKDFRVFALRSAHLLGRFPGGTTNPDLDGVLRADGFYNLGYPLLLWIARPLAADNPFLAARLIAALSGALLLAAGWWLARRLLGRGAALLALLLLALSPLIVEYALYVGTDMPFAAVCMLALALLIGRPTTDDRRPTTKAQIDMRPSIIGRSSLIMALAGLAGGTAFLIRHPGLLLLPFGWLVLWWAQRTEQQSHVNADLRPSTWRLRPAVVFTLAFALATLPQVAVNLRDTGQPFYSQQAKNVWQAMFGAGDWGRWGETANDISLGQVVAQDPQRFLANWWANLRGYFGTGGEDTREFGQSVQLRLLAFPANWLAIGGLLGWLAIGFQQWRRGTGDGGWGMGDGGWGTGDGDKSTSLTRSPAHPLTHSLLLWIVLYVGTLSIGLAPQPRFFLPLAPVYALAAAWTVTRLQPTIDDQRFSATRYALRNISLIVSLTLLALLWGSFAIGSGYVLRDRPADEVELARAESRAELPGQPADEARIIRLVQATLQPGERLIVRADPRIPIGKYSAIAHLALPAPASDAATALRASGARYLLWDTSLGVAPAVGGRIAGAGSYTLYRIDP